jgi:acyl carrier protein
VADAKTSVGAGPAAASDPGAVTPTGDAVLAAIRRAINVELGLAREVHPDDDLVADLHLDSMGLLTLVVELEDTFRIALGEEDSASVRTVRHLVSLVLSRTGGRP